MIWNIIGILLSSLSILISILCWRFAYSDIKRYNKYISQLYDIDFSKEGSLQKFNEIVKKVHNLEKSKQKTQVGFSNQKYENNKISKENFVACLFNANMNILNEIDNHQYNKKSGN